MKKALLYFFTLFFLGNLTAQDRTPVYSFFTAGHTYGNPVNPPNYGLYAPFVDYITTINDYPNMEFGFLTGDIVASPTSDYWDSAQIDINKLNMPVHLAAGNHDLGSEFVERFGNYYYSFFRNNDLFIILTPGLDAWNISGDQLEFLTNALDSGENVDNIFIFLHELIWWAPDNFYKDIKINYTQDYPGSTNYETVFKPLLLSIPNNITIYAGDLGATQQVFPFMFHAYNNITLIGSGMGGGVQDNIIITEVYGDSVYYNLVALNGDDPKALGEIGNFAFSIDSEDILNGKLRVYPNPCSGYFKVENRLVHNLSLSISTIYGQLIRREEVLKYSIHKVNTLDIKPGMYVLLLSGKDIFMERKLVIQ